MKYSFHKKTIGGLVLVVFFVGLLATFIIFFSPTVLPAVVCMNIFLFVSVYFTTRTLGAEKKLSLLISGLAFIFFALLYLGVATLINIALLICFFVCLIILTR